MRHTLRAHALNVLGNVRGVNLIEAAIVTPLLLLLMFSIADFSLLFVCWLSLHNGASQATRYAVTGRTSGILTQEASIKKAMRDATPLFAIPDESFSFSHMTPGSADWTDGIGAPGDIGRVTIDYTWTMVTPLVRPFFTDGQIRFVVDSTMKNEPRLQQ